MRAFLESRGEIGLHLLAVDWESTPIGPPETWPAALQNSVRILLTSRFSMWLAWGPELVFFCNESYRRDTLGKKYPWALGRPASEVWSEIWPDIAPRIERVMTTGEATWDESLQLFLERSGYPEETYHTFSYSPLADDDGTIAGMLCVVKEDTEEVIATRRMSTLRDLGTRGGELTESDAILSVCEVLERNPHSLPFTLIYQLDDDRKAAVRAGSTGFVGAHRAAPATIELGDAGSPWPVEDILRASDDLVIDVSTQAADLPTGAWEEPPLQAVAVPLSQVTQAEPYGFLIVGANRYRPLDSSYRAFVHLIASHLAAAIADARAFELEKQRAESLAAIDQAKTDFFTNVSHEFRTPLTLILGPTEDALLDTDHPLPPRQRERVDVVNRNAQRLLKLVNSLLDFSRLESGRTTSYFEQVDLAHYTTELASMFESACHKAGITLTVDCPPLPVSPYVDRDQWAKIVLNLLSNALKFTFEGGITVRLRDEAGAAVLTVSDTGTGVPPAELPHLFERFHRVRGARSRSHEGSGIGLALVAELAEMHGGGVDVDSVVGEGTTFRVRVPLGTSHLPDDRVSSGPSGPGAARSAEVAAQAHGFVAEALRWLDPVPGDVGAEAGGDDGDDRAQVLVVDDNVDMRQYVAELLASDYDVRTAADGLEALDVVRALRPDLVVTDVMMPRLDGFGLLRELQSDDLTASIPVIMLSARAGEEGTVEGLEAGADDYLVKPFSARELRARVRVNLELDRNRQVRSALERNRDLLDQAQRLAKVGSWEVDLSTGALVASEEVLHVLGRDGPALEALGYPGVLESVVHPEDRDRVAALVTQAWGGGDALDVETRVLLPTGEQRTVAVRAVVSTERGGPQRVRGSLQDVTEQRRAEQAMAAAAALAEAAAREHAIADELQRSLLPHLAYDAEHLDLATYYRAGVEGTQVGGDWYDVVELGAGRTALVVGDVMGRGVSAAATMGQLRAAVRAFAKLDLPPADVLEHLDGIVQDMNADQIVTCLYGVFDPVDQTLRYSNAGHLPPILSVPGGRVARLEGAGPPLGAGYFGMRTEHVQLTMGCTVTFYTDGLVERRGRDIDLGIDALVGALEGHVETDVARIPQLLVEGLLPQGPDDDIAILVARVNAERLEAAANHRIEDDEESPPVIKARRLVSDHLEAWGVDDQVAQELVLMTSELVTNALLHGRPPIDLRLRFTGTEVVLEIQDRAAYRPHRRRAGDDDEHGRGLQIVAALADRWGSRATGTGKSVWLSRQLPRLEPPGADEAATA